VVLRLEGFCYNCSSGSRSRGGRKGKRGGGRKIEIEIEDEKERETGIETHGGV
jgi:hypothetical protein